MAGIQNFLRLAQPFAVSGSVLGLASGISASGASSESAALADEEAVTLPPVVVTGQAPDGIGQASTLSWTLFDGARAQPGGVREIRDLSSLTPNLRVYDGNNDRAPRFSLRGIRENNFGTGEPAVGLYIDGVPYTDLTSRGAPLFDLARAEFLRGPQSTIFGASGPAGLIVANSRVPDSTWRGRSAFSYGNYDALGGELALSGPIVKECSAFGLASVFNERDGYVRNSVDGERIDDHETLAGRLQLRWTPVPEWDISFHLAGLRFRDGFVPTFYSPVDDNLFHVSRDYEGSVDTDENLRRCVSDGMLDR